MPNGRRKLTTAEEIRELRRSIDAMSSNIGKWLSAVATAAATPADNSAEVREQIAKITADVKGEADALEAVAEKDTNQ